MSTDLLRRVQQVYDRVAPLPPEQQPDALQRECGGDAELLAEVRSLLEFSCPPEAFLESSALSDTARFVSEEDSLEGRVFGAYRVEQRIAAGGMGAVYAAVRTMGAGSDEVAQRVALKIVKRGMDSEEIVRRFRQERRTLAKLSHPNIASLLDGGVLPDGRPFLVMEFVDGVPIDRACDERGLSLEARLRLFREVCRAVHFAHQNLIVHRDLKPGNILVTPDGIPKLLDFGIAKVINPGESGTHRRTELDERRLTPEFASPEQVAGAVVTTASDVYSLGVILYLLLTGQRPYDFPDRSPAAIDRVVCHQEPLPPSAASGVSHAAARALRGDLDNIALKALHKDPALRYPSAEQFADDVDRFLGGLPVSARAPTLRYHAVKFMRRHAAATAAAITLLAGLVLVIAVTAVQNRRIRAERDEANIARDQQELVVEIMRDALGAGGVDDLGAKATVSEAMDRLLREQLPRMSKVPRIRATLRHTIGLVYLRNSDIAGAEALITEAYHERLKLLGPDHHDTGESRMGLGELAFAQGHYDRAEGEFREALRIYRLVDFRESEDQAQALNDLGVSVRALGRPEEARAFLEESLRIRLSLAEPDDLRIAETYNNLGRVYANLDRLPDAFDAMEKAKTLRERMLPPDHALVLQILNNLANLRLNTGDYARAEELLLRVIPVEAKRLGPDHIRHAGTLANLGRVYLETGRMELAEALYRASLAIRVGQLAPESPVLLMTRLGLVRALTGQKDFEQAETVLQEAVAAKAPLIPEHRKAIRVAGEELYKGWGRDERAAAWTVQYQDAEAPGG